MLNYFQLKEHFKMQFPELVILDFNDSKINDFRVLGYFDYLNGCFAHHAFQPPGIFNFLLNGRDHVMIFHDQGDEAKNIYILLHEVAHYTGVLLKRRSQMESILRIREIYSHEERVADKIAEHLIAIYFPEYITKLSAHFVTYTLCYPVVLPEFNRDVISGLELMNRKMRSFLPTKVA